MFECNIDELLKLKLLEHRYAEELYELTNANRKYLREWLPWVDLTNGVEDTKKFINGTLEQFARNDGFQCGIFYNNQLVGCIGYHGINRSNQKTTIGYWLAEKFQGKGIMTRSCKKLVDYAFNELNLNRIEIQAGVNNFKSRAIPEKLGFSEEGILRQFEWVNDRFIDHVIYSMLQEEWIN